MAFKEKIWEKIYLLKPYELGSRAETFIKPKKYYKFYTMEKEYSLL